MNNIEEILYRHKQLFHWDSEEEYFEEAVKDLVKELSQLITKSNEEAYIAGLNYDRKKKKLYCKYCGNDYVPNEKVIGCLCGIPPTKRSKYHRWVYEDEHAHFENPTQKESNE